MNLRVYRVLLPSASIADNYYDTDQSWDFRMVVESNGVLKIFKDFTNITVGTKPQLVATYPKGEWIKAVDVSLDG